jgi:hypothetical protein
MSCKSPVPHGCRGSPDHGIGSVVLANMAEATLVGHVLVQMPLLAVAGWPFGSAFEPSLDRVIERWNRFGAAGFTLAIFTVLFWMVPRSVDGAVAHPPYEIFKFVSLPCAGAALALSLPRTHPLLAGALKANVVSMLAVLAWVYTAAPGTAVQQLSRERSENAGGGNGGPCRHPRH